MDEQLKNELVKDMEEFLDELIQRWYAARGFPYQQGYLLLGPPGTGKSSFSLSIAGRFDLDIYMLNLSGVGDSIFMKLFADLPPHCVILLEDVDAAGMGRRDDTNIGQMTKTSSGVTLSGLLNILDGAYLTRLYQQGCRSTKNTMSSWTGKITYYVAQVLDPRFKTLLLEKELGKVTAPKVIRHIKELLHEPYPAGVGQSAAANEERANQQTSIEARILQKLQPQKQCLYNID